MAGNKAQIRLGWETSEGVPGHDQDFVPFATEGLAMAPDAKDSANLDPSGNRPETTILGAHGTGTITGEFNSEAWLRARIHMWADENTGEAFFEQENQATGVERYTLRDFDPVDDDLLDFYAGSMHAGVWRDERENPTEYRALGMKAAKMTLSVKAGEFATIAHDFLYLREGYSDNPAEIAVNAAFTGELFVDGLRAPGDANGDEYNFKIPVGGDGVLKVAKLVWGKNDVYGTTEYLTATVINIKNADDTLASEDPKIPFRLLIIPGGVFTAGDEWKIDPLSLKPVAVFSTRPKLNGAAAMLEYTLGAVTKTRRIEEYTVEHYRPREAKPGIGSIYDQTIETPQDSRVYWTLSFSSTYRDLEIKQAMMQNRPFALHTVLTGGNIGSTGKQDYLELTFSDMRVTGGGGANIQSPGDNAENPTFQSAGASCTEVWQNTIASVEPT